MNVFLGHPPRDAAGTRLRADSRSRALPQRLCSLVSSRLCPAHLPVINSWRVFLCEKSSPPSLPFLSQQGRPRADIPRQERDSRSAGPTLSLATHRSFDTSFSSATVCQVLGEVLGSPRQAELMQLVFLLNQRFIESPPCPKPAASPPVPD